MFTFVARSVLAESGASCYWAWHRPSSILIQFQSSRIDAIPLAGRLWAVVEDVSQVCFAAAAPHFGSSHTMAQVGFGFDRSLAGRGIETRPAGAGVIFCFRTKQRLTATDARIRSRCFRAFVFPGERRFGSLLTGHIVLIRRELFLPRRIVFA